MSKTNAHPTQPVRVSEALYKLLEKRAKQLGYPHTITSVCGDALEHALNCAEYQKGRN